MPAAMPSRTYPRLRRLIRDVPDFPKPGILFRDLTPLLADPAGLREAVEALADAVGDVPFDVVAGIEARGFILGACLAVHLRRGFVPIRKKGKLPWRTRREAVTLEYGTDVIEIHEDAVRPGQRVLVVDDVLATGGTLDGGRRLVRQGGAEVAACAVLVELTALRGRDRLAGERVVALLSY